ncbi:hypothetical protein HK104_009756 [Borealophlyctis nickersoniae]|nr:hypothetical protein HK104_009756 [Borealophlyctis nickersoniae]
MATNVHTYKPNQMGMFEAVSLNNEALQHSNRGDYTTAETLHRRALEIKLALAGPDAIQTALTYNALGETLLQLGKFNEAEGYLKDALRIRRPERNLDTATSRENLAQCLEALGRLSEAKELREEDPEHVACGNYYCPKTQFGESRLEKAQGVLQQGLKSLAALGNGV